tara:strand:- start:253 stop:501 length:249 start_codon:yes stop_codon:yes gene_type:complete
MSRKERFYIIIKWHYNPTTNEVGKKKKLPVLMMDADGNPLEFDTLTSAEEFVDIMNFNTNQGFHYEIRELGKQYLKVNQKEA